MPRKKKPTGFKKVTHHYRRAWTNPFFKILNVIIFAAVFAWLGHYFLPSHAADLTACGTTGHSWPCHNDAQASNEFSLISNWRAGKGFYTYNRVSCLDAAASDWARQEAVAGRISNPPVGNLVDKYCKPNHYWVKVAANDGFGPVEPDIFSNFLASCEHFRNIADHGPNGRSYTMTMANGTPCTFTSAHELHVGTAVWVTKGGTRYVNHTFARWATDPSS